MSEKPNPNPYDPNVMGYNSLLGLFAQQQQRAALVTKVVAACAIIVILFLLFTIGLLSSRHPETYALVIDSSHKRVDMAQLTNLSSSLPYRELAVKSMLPTIITYAFSYTDSASLQTNLTLNVDPYLLGSSPAQAAMKTYISSLGPQGGTVGKITVASDGDPQEQSTNQWVTGWTTHQYDAQGNMTSQNHYTALVSVAWYPPSIGNVPGLYITDFKIQTATKL